MFCLTNKNALFCVNSICTCTQGLLAAMQKNRLRSQSSEICRVCFSPPFKRSILSHPYHIRVHMPRRKNLVCSSISDRADGIFYSFLQTFRLYVKWMSRDNRRVTAQTVYIYHCDLSTKPVRPLIHPHAANIHFRKTSVHPREQKFDYIRALSHNTGDL